jgi:fructose-bisphosphate aldolase, class I
LHLRFDAAKIPNTPENRAAYRSMLFTAPDIGKYISGVILYEETLYQKTLDGRLMTDLLHDRGIIPGIKVDKGTVELYQTNGETATQGLDGLADRCKKYFEAGVRFVKWRAVLKIGDGLPSELSIEENAHTLARYASICQSCGLVPIVEPEILTDGTHDIERCAYETERVLTIVFAKLNLHNVLLEGCLLKPNMVTPGEGYKGPKADPEQIAYYTVRSLQRTVPPALVGVVFLSGGQSEEEATVNLNAINKLPKERRPWALTFSYGRALQATCIKTWAGKPENRMAGKNALTVRAKANSEAQLGQYKGTAAGVGKESLYEAKYTY